MSSNCGYTYDKRKVSRIYGTYGKFFQDSKRVIYSVKPRAVNHKTTHLSQFNFNKNENSFIYLHIKCKQCKHSLES